MLGVLAIGIVLIAAAVFGSQYIARQMLHRDAVAIARHVATQIRPHVAISGTRQGDRGALMLGAAPLSDYMGSVNWFAALDTAFQPLSWSAGFSRERIVTAFKDPEIREGYTSAFVENRVTSRLYQLPARSANSLYTTVFVPATYRDGSNGAIAVNVDQTQAAAFLNSTLMLLEAGFGMLIALGMLLPFAIVVLKIRKSRNTEEQLEYLARHDTLTGLANRSEFQDALAGMLAAGEQAGPVGVFLIDIDRFKEFNDARGHQLGDMLLVAAARRIEELVGRSSKVARLSADEFAVACEIGVPGELIEIAERAQRIGQALQIRGATIDFSVSIGAASAPQDGRTPADLLRSATIALHRAKADGRGTIRFFTSGMDNALRKRRALESALRKALTKGGIDVHYQPQISLAEGRVNGYEALARWNAPGFGPVSPAVFVPLAEETGLIGLLSECVLRKACSYASNWPSRTKLAVNLSPTEFYAPGLLDRVRLVLKETGFPAERLELEITEGVLLKDSEAVFEILEDLRGLGISIAMDDFGTGYSSLAYLSRFPFTKLKIDRTFVAGLDDEHNAVIVRTILALAKSLGMVVTAEGVETDGQADFLRDVGCDLIQGYLVGRPTARVGLEELRLPHADREPAKIAACG